MRRGVRVSLVCLGLLVLVVAAGGVPPVGAAGAGVPATSAATGVVAAASSSQVIAAGTSATNLPTETVWPGAQNSPYICCWGSQGQFVTFSFTVAGGSTSLALRYSAGAGAASRKVELDGSVLVANQVFPATADWSTWASVTLNTSLTAGPHTLKVWWDDAAGSTQYLNLDNLTVTQGAPGVPVSSAPPVITGTAQQGQVLSASTGTWTNSPTSYAYQWNRCVSSCTPISGASASTYTLAVADVGATVTVTVTASNAAGAGVPATSAATGVVAAASSSQVIAAGTSATNLPTETVWPGAQNPPYICCWGSQGQFVTFSFTVAGGSTSLALRYSAGAGAASRKVELDGSVLVANQVFPATADWSTWASVTLNTSLTAGPHTLKVWWDDAAGSTQYLNLDNLTVTQGGPPPAGVTVALGYADGISGLTPWSGSPSTAFIGEPPQCCLTHGPNDGSPGFDSGAIEVTNSGASTATLDAVTADFGGGSSPSHFDLWGGGTAGTLPLSVPPGGHVVLTMTSSFNFDTSDLFGEACHANSGVVPVVHITVDGVLTDYLDDHQILSSDGADLASCPNDVSETVPFTTVTPGDQTAAAPINDVAPALTGPAIMGRVLSGLPGGWNASPPPTLASQWMRCTSSGASCNPIVGATGATYRPGSADVGKTLRFQVSASNASGKLTKASGATAIVQTGPAVAQLGDTSTGFTSVFANSATELGTIVTASAPGTTTDFSFYARGAGATQSFTPKVYSVVNGQQGGLLATGATISVPKGTNGQWYVSTLKGLHLTTGTQYDLALDPSGAGSTYVGAEPNGAMSFFVDYAP